VFISVTNEKNQENIGNYIPNSNTGKYVIIVPPGVYTVTVEVAGFQPYTFKQSVADKSSFKTEIDREIKLLPAGYTAPVPPAPPKPGPPPPKKK
jgi:hypothetical protein